MRLEKIQNHRSFWVPFTGWCSGGIGLDRSRVVWYTTSVEETSVKNVKITVEKNMLILKVDLSKDFGPSKSGKTRVIASTKGNVPIPDHPGCRIGLNVYTYANSTDAE